MLALVIMMGLISGVLSFGIAKSSAISMNSIGTSKSAAEAHNLAQNIAALVRATNYSDLSAQSRILVPNTSYDKEILVSDESDYSKTIKEKMVTVHIYKTGEAIPRATLSIKRYSVENESEVPVGTVIAWAGAKAPTTNGTWLECNGQSCASYPALVAVLGKKTVPDYRNKFLESSVTAGTVKEAGLPNITGTFNSYDHGSCNGGLGDSLTGAFYGLYEVWYHVYSGKSVNIEKTGTIAGDVKKFYSLGLGGAGIYAAGEERTGFDASLSSSIYGNSDTVQPASVTVRRFIKAA